jgi:hypothetical protein
MIPENAMNYFAEASRVLKPYGRCVLSFFLLDYYQSDHPRPLGFNRTDFNFDYSYKDYGDDFAIVFPDNPEQMTAYRLRFIERLSQQNELTLAREPVPGIWSGTVTQPIGAQDIVILQKN